MFGKSLLAHVPSNLQVGTMKSNSLQTISQSQASSHPNVLLLVGLYSGNKIILVQVKSIPLKPSLKRGQSTAPFWGLVLKEDTPYQEAYLFV